MYADGELPPDEAAAVERLLEADEAQRERVEFEQTLRRRVGKVIEAQAAAAPAGLAEQVRSALAGADDPAPEGGEVADQDSGGFGWSWLAGPRRANIFAVAASLMVVAGAVLWGIFGRTIDSHPGPVDLTPALARFVADEHIRCADSSQVRANKAKFRTPAEVEAKLSRWLGAPLNARPMTDGLAKLGWGFTGGGYCGVPVAERSGHLIFTRDLPDVGPIMLSIFVIPDDGYSVREGDRKVSVRPGRWYPLPSDRKVRREVWIMSDGELIYLMAACVGGELPGAARALQEAIWWPGR